MVDQTEVLGVQMLQQVPPSLAHQSGTRNWDTLNYMWIQKYKYLYYQ